MSVSDVSGVRPTTINSRHVKNGNGNVKIIVIESKIFAISMDVVDGYISKKSFCVSTPYVE